MLMDAAGFLIRKAFEAKYKGRKVDQQIASCYTDFIMNGSLVQDSLQDFKEMLNQMLSAVNLFDKNGKPENMYVSYSVSHLLVIVDVENNRAKNDKTGYQLVEEEYGNRKHAYKQ